MNWIMQLMEPHDYQLQIWVETQNSSPKALEIWYFGSNLKIGELTKTKQKTMLKACIEFPPDLFVL